MVPVPLTAGAWHEAQIDELFASLLGKGFEMGDNHKDDMEDIQPSAGPALELSADALKGFKIFG
jgi:protein AATF/BFR2